MSRKCRPERMSRRGALILQPDGTTLGFLAFIIVGFTLNSL